MSELLVAFQEAHIVSVSEVLDVAIALIDKESFNKVVELVLVEVSSYVSQCVVRPVGVLNSMKKAIVLGDPKTILESLEIGCRVQAIARSIYVKKLVPVLSAVLLLCQVLYYLQRIEHYRRTKH